MDGSFEQSHAISKETLPSDGEAAQLLHEVRLALAHKEFPELDPLVAASKWINTYGVLFEERITKRGDFWKAYQNDPEHFSDWVEAELKKDQTLH